MLLTGTNRMLGHETASQIASASLLSFLPLFRYGLTNLGAIRRGSWPSCRNCRAHSWAPQHASRPMTQGGSCATNDSSLLRPIVRRTSTLPPESTPCTENTFFARSIPTVVTLLTGLPPLGWIETHTHFNFGTDVPLGRGSPLHSLDD